MRILHITGYTVERGGTAKIVYENAKYQISKGHEVSILSVDFNGEEPYPVPKGAKLLLMKDHWLGKFISNYSAETNIFFKSHKGDFELIHVHGIWFWGAVAPFIYKSKAKIVITIHGMLSKWTMSQGVWKKRLFGWAFQNKGLKKAAAIFVNTEKEKRELLDYINIPESKIFIVPNAVEQSEQVSDIEKNNYKNTLGIEDEKRNVLFLSRIHKKKGLDLLIKAFAKLSINHRLLIAGPDEGFKNESELLIKKLGISERVIFLGSVSGKTKQLIYSIADIYVLSSHSEGFPMAVMEAIEALVPVVVSDQTRIDHYISKYEAGKVSKLDVDDIYKAMTEILEDNVLAEKYKNNGTEMLKKEFMPEIIFPKMLAVYEKV